MKHITLLFVFFTLFFAQDRELNFQGVLRQPSGKAVADGSYSISFKVYNQENAGTELKNDTKAVTVYNGVYSTPIDITGLGFNEQYWIGISIDGGAELSPRVKLATSSYAMALVGESNKFPSTGTVVMGDSLRVSGSMALAGSLTLSGQLKLNNGTISGALTLSDKLKFNGSFASIQSGAGDVTNGDLGLYSLTPSSWMRFVSNEGSFNWFSDGGINPNGGTAIMSLNKDGYLNFSSLGLNAPNSTTALRFENSGVISLGGNVTGTSDMGLYSQVSGRVMRFVTNAADIRWYADSGKGSTAIMGLAKNGRLDVKYGASIFGDYGKYAINLERSGVISFEDGGFSGGTSDMGLYSKSAGRDMRFVTNNRNFLWFTAHGSGVADSHGDNWKMKLHNYGNLEVKRDILTHELFQTSDVRFKKNIVSLSNSLEQLNKLRGVSFFWKDIEKGTAKQIGFIAQEVEKIYPEFVNTDQKGFKSVAYSKVTAVLVEAVKEQNNQIKTLQETVANLKAELSASKKLAIKVASLESLMAKLLTLDKKTKLSSVN